MITKYSRIICIGECMVEFYDAQNGSWHRGFAGDTLNVAWALRGLLNESIKIDYITRVGSDQLSNEMLDFFKTIGLGTDCIQIDQDCTVGMYTISLDGSGERSFSYWRGESAAKRLAADVSVLSDAVKETDLIYLSGITAAILDLSGRENLLSCLRCAKSNGSRIAYDPNYRKRLWSCLDSMKDFTTEIVGLADIILPTYDDEVQAFCDGSKEDTFRRLSALGCNEIVIKDGVKPTQVMISEDKFEIALRCSNTPVDTTGAGDSFNGAYLAARFNGQDSITAVQKAQAISAEVVMHRGALVGHEILRDAFTESEIADASKSGT
jgi:2-dehydro-3-deoxygluconokinase